MLMCKICTEGVLSDDLRIPQLTAFTQMTRGLNNPRRAVDMTPLVGVQTDMVTNLSKREGRYQISTGPLLLTVALNSAARVYR